MGSDLYAVRVVAKRDRVVTLDVRVEHPDSMVLPADRGFALMMLHEHAKASAPLAEAVGYGDVTDKIWVGKYAAGFVAKVRVSRIKNKPSKAALADRDHAYWNGDAWMSGTVEVTVTDPAWIQHVKPGARWDSRAFQLVEAYAACPPAKPGDAAGAATVGDGFMMVPSEIWATRSLPAGAPRFVEVPAYAEGAYSAKHPLKTITPAAVAPLLGRCVRVSTRSSKHTRDGVLLLHENGGYTMCCLTERSGGTSQDDLTSVALLELKPNARQGTRLRYKRVLDSIMPRVVAVRCKKAKAEIDVSLSPDGEPAALGSKPEILRLLATPLIDWNDPTGNSPLAQALRKDMKQYEVSEPEQLANGYIVSFKVTYPRKKMVPALDTMPAAAVRAYFEAPRPIARVVVEVTDAHWLDHLAKAKPFYIEEWGSATSMKWTAPPRRWK